MADEFSNCVLGRGGGMVLTGHVPVPMVLTNEDVETIEHNDQGEVGESKPGSVWLEVALEYESVAVNSLCIERLVELDIRKAD